MHDGAELSEVRAPAAERASAGDRREGQASAKEQLLVDVTGFETRIALMRDGELLELHLERTDTASLIGNLYYGEVRRVVPSVEAAFVDIGEPRLGFLGLPDTVGGNTDARRRIDDVVRQGQRLLVQVTKDPLNGKGTRLTANVALTGRYLVFLPFDTHVGVSRRVIDEAERTRLRGLVESAAADLDGAGGCIVRTAATTASAERIRTDLAFLHRQWQEIGRRLAEAPNPPTPIAAAPPLPIRVLRDLPDDALEAVLINDDGAFATMVDYIAQHMPHLRDRAQRYPGAAPLFDVYGVEAAIARALDKRVRLPSNGHLVIEHTEAMTTIDVNSGSYVDSTSEEDTAFKTNLEAAGAIPRELRARNIGGIVVVDFIDMRDTAHQDAVLAELVAAAADDPAYFRANGFTPLGLVEISRRRTRDSLLRQLSATCPECAGHNYVKSPQSVGYDLLRAVQRRVQLTGMPVRRVRAAPAVVARLRNEDEAHLAAIAQAAGHTIRLQAEHDYRNDQFDLE